MRKYFTNINPLEELKKEYFKLNKKYHLDLNKDIDIDIIQAINAEYDEVFKQVKDKFTNKDVEPCTKENKEKSEEFKDIIEVLIKFEKVEIEILGCFIWLDGDTYEHKEDIKKTRFQMVKKQKWYKSPKGYIRYGDKKYSYNDIQNIYGVVKVENEETTNKLKNID